MIATNLATITRDEILRRARSVLGRGSYKLGRGGFDPNAQFPWHGPDEFCDCSGFVSWLIAEDRETTGLDGGWIETSAMIADANGPARMFAKVEGAAQPGDILVFGDIRVRAAAHTSYLRQGHTGVVSQVNASGDPYQTIHCSGGNQKQFDHAIAETSPGVFLRNGAILIRARKVVECAP